MNPVHCVVMVQLAQHWQRELQPLDHVAVIAEDIGGSEVAPIFGKLEDTLQPIQLLTV